MAVLSYLVSAAQPAAGQVAPPVPVALGPVGAAIAAPPPVLLGSSVPFPRPWGVALGDRQGLDAFAEGQSPLRPTLLSLVVPGSGQLLLRQRRGWAYLAVETLGWILYADRRSEGGRYRTLYRDLAWETARTGTGARVDGDFGYYERLTQWSRSGAFDVAPTAAGVQPETDPTTFNGSVWNRARGIFSVAEGATAGTPSFDAAVRYYQQNAYGESFLWDWTGEPESRERFSAWIRESDERFREATWTLGLMFTNHLISAVDAWISAPVSVSLAPSPGGSEGAAVQILLSWEPNR